VFAGNNPVNFVDPFGLDAWVRISPDGKTMDIDIPVRWGNVPKASQESITKQIQEAWSATGVDDFLDVNTQIVPPGSRGGLNTITLTKDSGTIGVVENGHYMTLGPTGLAPSTPAHEAGHLLGFEDVSFRTGQLRPNWKGWGGNIMSYDKNRSPIADERNYRALYHQFSGMTRGKWHLVHGAAGKEFQSGNCP
jgi:hypothetical protein